MATADEPALPADAVRDRLDRFDARLGRYGLDLVHVAVAALVLLALATRLYGLGARAAHWDEARVVYWTMQYVETGNVQYRPMIHGPFFHHVNEVVFGAIGASEFSMRLVVALVGGLFPLVALCFRDRFRDVEVVALAAFFAANPVLLYYSRFMRGDPLVGMFMVAAFGLFVRTIDSGGRKRYFYAAVAFVALGFTVKENALLYLICWLGAAALLLDHRLFRAADHDQQWDQVLVGYLWRTGRTLRRWAPAIAVGAVEFLVVIVYFYAPRSPTEPGPGLWAVVDDPSAAPAVLEAATIGAAGDLWGQWVSGAHQDHPYLPFLRHFLETMGHGALALCALAVLGFLVDRYSDRGPRDLVAFAAYWGFASVLGYPLVTDIKAPWATIHAILPLAIPAAVGAGLLVRWGYEAYADRDRLGVGIAALVLVLVVAQVAVAGAGAVYMNPQSSDNGLVQYAQPADDVRPVTDRVAAAAANESGPDVVLYGDFFVDGGDASAPRQPGCAKWFNALPLPWYFESSDANVTCAEHGDDLAATVDASDPAVVITRESAAGAIDDELPGYEPHTYRLRAWDTETTFFVREDYAEGLDAPA